MTHPARHAAVATVCHRRRQFFSLLPAMVLLGIGGGIAHAATPDVAVPAAGLPGPPVLQGRSASGQTLSLEALRGRVVLAFFWSTGCAVCRDKMGELRANVSGWKGQPFTLLGVNMDDRLDDVRDYERLVALTTPVDQRLVSIWAGSPDFRNSLGAPVHLPSAVLFDKQGQVVQRYNGRIPPEAWDDMAALL